MALAVADSVLSMEESLVRSLQKILRSEAEDFTEDTILNSDINQIRHLFYWLRAEQRAIQVSYANEVYTGHVHDVDEASVTVDAPGFQEESMRRCRLKFESLNTLYQFEVPILQLRDEQLVVRLPAYIQSAKRRKHRRVFADDLFMRFGILYQPLHGRRGAGQLIEQRYPYIVSELRRDEPDLALINRIVSEEISKVSRDFLIFFYPPEYRKNLMESLIAEEKKSLFLRDVSRLQTYVESQSLLGPINYNREYRSQMRNSESEDEALGPFRQIQRQDMERLIANYVCSPLMIFDEVVGHIYVSTAVLDRHLISYDEAYRIDLLAQLLSYAMSKTVIARSYFRHTYTRVINISMGGLLFELTNRQIFDFLTFHDKLNMLTPVRHSLLNFKGEITRFYPSRDGFNIGVRFFHAGPDDYRMLESFIYDRNKVRFG
ncbi:MAG: DUF1577 domain-containing protein [Leptospirales bacterium]|nr:DUF1577 domain-containing protein [Leptospirales bacterium]